MVASRYITSSICGLLLLATGQNGALAFSTTNTRSLVVGRSLDSRLATPTMPTIRQNTQLQMWSSDDDEIEGIEKFKSCIPYMLPLLDGEMFGKYIYERIPPLGFLDSLFVGPLYESYSHAPFLGTLIFVGLTLGTRGNTDMSRNLRFNAQQAALIDILLIAPELIGESFVGEDIPRYIQEPCMNFVWYCYMSMVLYSIFMNLRGKKPSGIPWVSGYAEVMVGPL